MKGICIQLWLILIVVRQKPTQNCKAIIFRLKKKRYACTCKLYTCMCKLYTCMCTYQRRQWHPTPVLLPGKSHGWRSLVGCSPWGRWGSDTTERLHFHFSLSCIGEGNGNPIQCSCLENPRDGGAWWAAVYGVAQSRTRLKWLSSSSSMCTYIYVYTQVHIPTYIQSVSHCAHSFMPYLFFF